ncbi:MAG: hypothetical protein CMJ82_07205 [Planctomycetaceae bacterium]|nr:hypothetical protein [Planctomycetaceae bacterium]
MRYRVPTPLAFAPACILTLFGQPTGAEPLNDRDRKLNLWVFGRLDRVMRILRNPPTLRLDPPYDVVKINDMTVAQVNQSGG